jgi:hypothetical protein
MFRVLRDREQWFQVVMNQKFEFDEATSEELGPLSIPAQITAAVTEEIESSSGGR